KARRKKHHHNDHALPDAALAAMLCGFVHTRGLVMRKKLVAGNWKMHGSRAMASELMVDIAEGAPQDIDVAVYPPFPYVAEVAACHGGVIGVGAQDVSAHAAEGAFTGEVSAAMLRDIGCSSVLVCHSERRHYHDEEDDFVAAQLGAVVVAIQ